MKHGTAVLMVAGVALWASVAVAQDGQEPSSVPVALQGDWAVPSEPSYDPQFKGPDASVRITASNYVYRLREMKGFQGAWDRDTGESMTWVKDPDGVNYCEQGRYLLSVRTNTAPWEIDLRREGKDGQVIEKKGLCIVQGDTLKLSIGKLGKDRPTSFENLPGGDEHTIIVADRTGKMEATPKPGDARLVVYIARNAVAQNDVFQLHIDSADKVYFAKIGEPVKGITILQYDRNADRIEIWDDVKGTSQWISRK